MKKPRPAAEPKPKKEIPYSFVLEEIASLAPYTKAMFGAHAIYSGDLLLLIVRKKDDAHTDDNGIWISTSKEHHASLLAELPSMRGIYIFSAKGPTDWRILPEEDPRFEADAFRLCELVRKRDPRIGRVPKGRKKAKAAGAKSPTRKSTPPSRSKKPGSPKTSRAKPRRT